MAAVTPRLFVFGFIIFTLLIMGGISIMSEMNRENPSFINDNKFIGFNKTFNKYNELIEASEKLESSIEGAKADKGIFGVLDSLIQSAWGTIKSFFSTFDFVKTAFGGLSSVFGIPYWVSSLITSLVTILFVFSIYSLIFQGKT